MILERLPLTGGGWALAWAVLVALDAPRPSRLRASAKETGEPVDCRSILRDLHLRPEGALGAAVELAPRDGKAALGNVLLEGSRLARRFRHVPAVAKVLDEPLVTSADSAGVRDARPNRSSPCWYSAGIGPPVRSSAKK
jgi:hypothetical protein